MFCAFFILNVNDLCLFFSFDYDYVIFCPSLRSYHSFFNRHIWFCIYLDHFIELSIFIVLFIFHVISITRALFIFNVTFISLFIFIFLSLFIATFLVIFISPFPFIFPYLSDFIYPFFILDPFELEFKVLLLKFQLHVLILKIPDVFYPINEFEFFFLYHLSFGLPHKFHKSIIS